MSEPGSCGAGLGAGIANAKLANEKAVTSKTRLRSALRRSGDRAWTFAPSAERGKSEDSRDLVLVSLPVMVLVVLVMEGFAKRLILP